MAIDLRSRGYVWVVARVALVLAGTFAVSCAPLAPRSLELGNVLGVRGHRVEVAGQDRLEGSVGWGLSFVIAPQRSAPVVHRARFGVGTASRWTLRGELPDGAAWPDTLTVSRAMWDVEVESTARSGMYTFDLDVGQTLTRVEPCDGNACAYAFTAVDAHRDVFSFEVVAGRDAFADEWLNEIDQGIEGRVSLVLYVTIQAHGDALPMAVASIPLAPSGSTLEFRP